MNVRAALSGTRRELELALAALGILAIAWPLSLARRLHQALGRLLETEEVSELRRKVAEARRRNAAAQEAGEQFKRWVTFAEARRWFAMHEALDTAGASDLHKNVCPCCRQALGPGYPDFMQRFVQKRLLELSALEASLAGKQAVLEASLAAAERRELEPPVPTIEEATAEWRAAYELLHEPAQARLLADLAGDQAELDKTRRRLAAVSDREHQAFLEGA